MLSTNLRNLLLTKVDESIRFACDEHQITEQTSGLTVAIDGSNPLERRVRHTLSWCKNHKASFHFPQEIFNLDPNAAKIFFRNFSFHHTKEGIALTIGPITPHSPAFLNAGFESNMFDFSSDAIVVTITDLQDEPSPKIVYCNRSFCEMTGYEREQLLGRSPKMLQGPQSCSLARYEIRKALNNWSRVRQRITNYRKDGSTFDVELNISPVPDQTGWFCHWLSVQRDMSEESKQLASSKQRQLILENCKVACWSYNFTQNKFFFDRRMQELHGMRDGLENMTLDSFLQCIHPTEQEQVSRTLTQAITGEGSLDIEYQLCSDEFTQPSRWLRLKAELIQSENTRVLSGICFDISHERESRQIQEHYQKQKDNYSQQSCLAKLAAGVGHEIKNPLAIINSATDLLELSLHQKQQQNIELSLERVREAVDRINKIVNGLQDTALTSTSDTISATTDIIDILNKVTAQQKPQYLNNGVALSIKVPQHTSRLPIAIAPQGLEQVLVNLLDNALNAARDSVEKQVSISMEVTPITCKVTVTDTGPGIPEAIRDSLFHPFSNSELSSHRKGLGLSVSRGIIESSGGKIGYCSEPGEKTKFYCEFLRAHITEDAVTHSHTATPYDFLLVTENAAIEQKVTAQIRLLGSHCRVMATLKQAQEAVEMDSIDIVIVCLDGPAEHLWEFLMYLRQKNTGEEIVSAVISNFAISNDKTEYLKLKNCTDEFLAPPIRTVDIARLITWSQEKKRLQQ